jgi:starch synthase
LPADQLSKPNELSVLSVAAEAFPLIKTGGLADVVGALPGALAAEGIDVRTLLPGYPAVMAALRDAAVVHALPQLHGAPARVLAGRAAGLDLFVLDAPHLYARPGSPYGGPDGEWPDNGLRFAALAQVAADLGHGAVGGYAPDVIQAHDWHAGLVPAYLHYAQRPRPGTVMTIHNLAYQGQFPRDLLAALGLPPQAFAHDGVESHGAIGYLKAGIALADRVTTVSPTYAAEILTDEGSMGLGDVLNRRAAVLTGILNGIDDTLWNPATDVHLASRFAATGLAARASNKAALQARFGLDRDSAALLVGVVSRLTWQKGMDLLLAALPVLLRSGAQLAMLGSGDQELEGGFADAARRHPGRIGAWIGYDEALAHLVQGGADAVLVPSRFEPCGLTQLAALRYGAIPVVARVGGLADSVVDASVANRAAGVATGVQFAPVTQQQLEVALDRTLALWRDPRQWRVLQARAMSTDVGWGRSAKDYEGLFRDLVTARGA